MKKIMVLLPLIAGVLWGSAGVFVRKLSEIGMDNFTILSSRMSLAALCLFLGILIYDRSWFKVKLKDLGLLFATGFFTMVGLNYTYVVTIKELSLSFAAVLLSLSPIFVMILSYIFFKEKMTKKKILFTGLALVGCFLVSGFLESSGYNISAKGILIGLGSAFFYALYSILSKIAMKRGYNVFTITFYSIFFGSIVLAFFSDWGLIFDFATREPVSNISFMLVHSLFTSVLPYVLYTMAFQYVDTNRVAILAAGGEPSAAMIFGLMFYNEMPSIISFIGLILTIIALSVICREE